MRRQESRSRTQEKKKGDSLFRPTDDRPEEVLSPDSCRLLPYRIIFAPAISLRRRRGYSARG